MFENNNLLIQHAFSDFGGYRSQLQFESTPVSRISFVIVFRTAPASREAGAPIPHYGHHGEAICSLLSVLFGKRFDLHGPLEHNGIYHIPEFSVYDQICNPNLPFNSRVPRNSNHVPLKLGEVTAVEHVIDSLDQHERLLTACRFYLLALQNAERVPEIAYLHIVTAGEVLSHIPNYERHELCAQQTIDDLDEIEEILGPQIARRIESQFRHTKRRFVRYLTSDLTEEFFTKPEARFQNTDLGNFTRETIERSVASSYDLRSKFVHVGLVARNWLVSPFGSIDRYAPGKPVMENKELERIISHAAAFSGLERLIRYHILLEIDRRKDDQ